MVRIISYADQRLLTSDDLAASVLEYAVALARAGTSDIIEFPTVGEGGEVRRAEIIIGPSSQIVVLESSVEDIALDEASTIEDLATRARRVGAPTAAPAEQQGMDERSAIDDDI